MPCPAFPSHLQQRCLFGVRKALEELRADLEPLSRSTEVAGEGALDQEVAAGHEAPKREGAEGRERARRVEANLQHVLAEVGREWGWEDDGWAREKAGSACWWMLQR